jgi:hypothetical protein
LYLKNSRFIILIIQDVISRSHGKAINKLHAVDFKLKMGQYNAHSEQRRDIDNLMLCVVSATLALMQGRVYTHAGERLQGRSTKIERNEIKFKLLR